MNTEIEAKFLNVNFDDIRAKLAAPGAMYEQPMRLMCRVIIEPPELAARNALLCVRDEGDKVVRSTAKQLGFNWESAVFGKVTITYLKQYPAMKLDQFGSIKRAAFGDPIPAIISGEEE